MNRFARILVIIIRPMAAVLLATSVGVFMPRSFQVVDHDAALAI